MSTRVFRDARGVEWQVFEVTRAHREVGAVRPELEQGWLCFQSDLGKRRLGNPPAGWRDLPDDALEELLDAATTERTRPSDPWRTGLQVSGGA